jgi:signal transduction histidine kinase
MFHDISERKTFEKNLIIAKENAEQADKMKSMFLAKMSHEIRTPLNSIIGFSDLLEDDDITKDERDRYVQIIRKNGEKLLAFIDNLLDISSLETQKIHIEKNSCSHQELMQDLYEEILAQQKKQKKSQLH